MNIRTVALMFAATVLSYGLTACCGGDDSPKCQAELAFAGVNASGEDPFRGWGTGKTEAEAGKNACWDYCRNADTNFDAKYAISVDAMKKKGTKLIPRKADWHRFDAALKKAHKKCVDRCQSASAKGKSGFSVTTECGVVPKEPDYARKRREALRKDAKKAGKKKPGKKKGGKDAKSGK